MNTQGSRFNLELSRRKLLAAAGIAGGAVAVASLIGTAAAQTAPISRRSLDPWRQTRSLHLRSPD
jgi:hypothetical protein